MLFLTFLDTTVVSVALADIQSNLTVGVSALQWVVNGYALVFASFMLAAGNLGDRFGRRRLMLGGVAVFCVGSLLGALAPSIGVLIAARVVMGLGAAASEPGTLSVLRHLYPDPTARARAMGAWAAVSGLAIALGPVIGGVLVGISGWRAVFWFNLVAGLGILWAAARHVPESADEGVRRLDVGGLVFGVVALVSITFAIIEGETRGYSSPWIIGLGALGLVTLVLFVVTERRTGQPLLDLGLFRRPAFSGALVVAFAISFGLFAIFFFVALYLQLVVSYSGYRVALVFLPMAALMVVASFLGGRWVSARGPAGPMTTGCALAGSGILATDLALRGAPFGPLALALALAGMGLGLALVPVVFVVLDVVPPERSGMGASVANTARELGSVFGVAVLGALVYSRLISDLTVRLDRLHVAPAFKTLVLNSILDGGVSDTGTYGSNPAIQPIINSAYGAFRVGTSVALLVSGILVLVLVPVAWGSLRHPRAP